MLAKTILFHVIATATLAGLAAPAVQAKDPWVREAQSSSGQINVTTGATGLNLNDLLDVVVQVDARSWMMNRYVPKSMHNARYLLTNRDETTYTAYGEYDYEGLFGSASGWVKVAVVDGDLVCLEFWDQPGVCRPPWISLSQQRFFNEMVNQSIDTLRE